MEFICCCQVNQYSGGDNAIPGIGPVSQDILTAVFPICRTVAKLTTEGFRKCKQSTTFAVVHNKSLRQFANLTREIYRNANSLLLLQCCNTNP